MSSGDSVYHGGQKLADQGLAKNLHKFFIKPYMEGEK